MRIPVGIKTYLADVHEPELRSRGGELSRWARDMMNPFFDKEDGATHNSEVRHLYSRDNKGAADDKTIQRVKELEKIAEAEKTQREAKPKSIPRKDYRTDRKPPESSVPEFLQGGNRSK